MATKMTKNHLTLISIQKKNPIGKGHGLLLQKGQILHLTETAQIEVLTETILETIPLDTDIVPLIGIEMDALHLRMITEGINPEFEQILIHLSQDHMVTVQSKCHLHQENEILQRNMKGNYSLYEVIGGHIN